MNDGSPLPSPGDTVAGKYVIERVIGQGGMSVVYGATHRVTNKRFAIKWLLPDESATSADGARRFIREAQVAGLFQHPNVVEVYDVGQVSGSFYMVMEWLEGESLADRVDRVGAMPFEDMRTHLIPCMHGVCEAHSVGIVHRDLKPANIFLCRAMHHTPERPKVLDFGIAKLSQKAFDVSALVTKSGVLIGTPHYLSPEQLRSQPVDHRTDIYAFGVIMYQLLSGKLPFPADNFGQLVLQIATGTPVPLRELAPDLPPGAELVVAHAMAREPQERFQDVRELIEALEMLGDDVPVVVARPPRSGPPPLPSTRVRYETPSAAQVPAYPGHVSVIPPQPAPAPQLVEAGPLKRMLTYLVISTALVGVALLIARFWYSQPYAAEGDEPPPVAMPAEPPRREDPITTATVPAAGREDGEEAQAAMPAHESVPAADIVPALVPNLAARPDPAAAGAPAKATAGMARPKRPRASPVAAAVVPPTEAQPPPAPAAAPPADPMPPAPAAPPKRQRNPLDMELQ
jgi:serine/threonine protein kinase